MQDLKRLQELKRKEIEEKLEKLKEITGNPSIGFEVYLDLVICHQQLIFKYTG